MVTDGRLKALVIDDSLTAARILANLLIKQLRADVEIARDGLGGLEKLSAEHFDLVFLDLQMPRMTGLEVLRKIRESPATTAIPVIVITGSNDAETVRSLIPFNIFDYVIKPFDAALIVKRFETKFDSLRSQAVAPSAE